MSARPIGLGLRQTPDARVVQLTPYRARPDARTVMATSAALALAWGVARATTEGPVASAASALFLLALGALIAAWWRGRRRAARCLEVYVGRRDVELVESLDGRELSRARHALAPIVDTERGPEGVVAVRDDGSRWHLPMGGSCDEARAWMVEHLRESARDARKRA